MVNYVSVRNRSNVNIKAANNIMGPIKIIPAKDTLDDKALDCLFKFFIFIITSIKEGDPPTTR